MAKRNRKKNKQYSVMSKISPLLIILVLVAALSLAYLWMSDRCETLGSEIQHLETVQQELHQRLQHEQSDWSYMQSRPGVRKALDAFGLDMRLPEKHRIVMVRPVNLRPENPRKTVHRYAQLGGRTR